MKTSNEVEQLFAALLDAQMAMPVPQKDKRGQYGFYQTLSSVLNAVLPVLNDRGLFVIQSVGTPAAGVPGADNVSVTTRIAHASGQWIEDTLTLPIGGRGSNLAQDAGGSITYYKRYGLAAMLALGTEDDDGESAAAPQRSAAQATVAPPAGPPQRKNLGPAELRQYINERSVELDGEGVTEADQRKAVGTLARILGEGYDHDDRHNLSEYLFGQATYNLGVCNAIHKWAGWWKDADGEWHVNPVSREEARAALNYYRTHPGG